MSLSAREENAKTLGRLLALDDDDAAALLDIGVAVRAEKTTTAACVYRHALEMLKRTVATTGEQPSNVAAEVIIGELKPSTPRPVRVGITTESIVISCEVHPAHDSSAEVPEILLLIAACYAAAMAVRVGVGTSFPLPYHDTIRLPVDLLLRGGRERLREPISIGRAYVAGAGAIGNGLLWALTTMDVQGELHIVDPKRVSVGNLGRCLWFSEEDVGQPKAERLAARAQGRLLGINLVPRVLRLQELEERSLGPWLERLVVAVDSRRARRRLQDELPLEVLDASTTGIEEVVLHFNSAREEGACLSCIYIDDDVEDAHERHVAEMLGVEVTDVKQHFIGADAAIRVARRHPQLDGQQLVGVAYDTLFKALCATGELGADEGRTVLAPFSFVSTLAGAYLALELALRMSAGSVPKSFNYWRASPWTSPVMELQGYRPACPDCETCSQPTIRATMDALWGLRGEKAT